MEASVVCRTCLSTDVSKNISDLKSQQSDKNWFEIVLFCLNIQVKNDSNISTKLCLKCYRKILSFYNFKLIALKSDAYLKDLEPRLHIKSEVFLEEDLKSKALSLCDSDDDKCYLFAEIKQEPIKDENDPDASQSDDELLSEIKKIKYEFIPEANDIKESKKVNLKPKQGKNSKKTLSKPKVCVECGKSVKDLKEHMLRHRRRSDPSLRLPCPLCDKTYSSYDARSKHKRKTHLSQKTPCPICNKVVKNLKSHKRCMHNSSDLSYKCVQCEKHFYTLSQLNLHSSVHTKDRPHSCDECNKTFRLSAQVTAHKKEVHGKKIFMCQFCSKSFTRDHHLERHLRIHTKEKPFKCKECDKAFNTTSALKYHVYTHSGIKPFICKICDKGFGSPGNLQLHMLTHTREKRYPCRYCDMKFHRSDHRTQHEAAIHKMNKNQTFINSNEK